MKQRSEKLKGKGKKLSSFLFLLLLPFYFYPSAFAAEDTPARLFFSDAKISFIFPQHWKLEPSFPYGPLFSKATREGDRALIACAISAPLEQNRVSADISTDVLKELAKREMAAHHQEFKIFSESERELAGHHAYEMTWEDVVQEVPLQHQSVYFFVENRLYALTLQARSNSFRWIVPDFQGWLTSLRILSRTDSGALGTPAHGGLWIHQNGGVKIWLPSEWLIAVADDLTLGATVVQGTLHNVFTATVDLSSSTIKENKITRQEKKELRKAIAKKGYRIMKEWEAPFHGFPAFQVEYEGSKDERYVEAQDILVVSPKAHWLFSFEGDLSLFHAMGDQFTKILKNIQFL